MAGTVGWSIVSPSPNSTWNITTPIAATKVPATRPVAPEQQPGRGPQPDQAEEDPGAPVPVDAPQHEELQPTMTTVFAAKARPIVRVDTSLTCRANAGKPGLHLAVADEARRGRSGR